MASGRPDWYSSVAMHGKFAEEGEEDKYITVNVDELGNMLALMTGKLNSTYTPVAVDDQGIMKANLALQDLDPLMISPSFGKAGYRSDDVLVEGTDEVSLFTQTGRGTIYTGYVYWISTATSWNDIVSLYIDGDYFYSVNPATCRTRGQYEAGVAPLYLAFASNAANVEYCIRCTPGITFDESFEVRYDPATVEDFNVAYLWTYALTEES